MHDEVTCTRNAEFVNLVGIPIRAPSFSSQSRSFCFCCFGFFIPSGSWTSRQSELASLMFFKASDLVLPWLTHPGMDWHSATQIPSSSWIRGTSTSSTGIGVFFTGLHILWPVYPLEYRCRIQRANGIPLPESSFALAPAHACAFRAISSSATQGPACAVSFLV